MNFKKGLDDWEYGHITVQVWMAVTLRYAMDGEDDKPHEHFIKTGGNELLESFRSGEAKLSHAQSLIFFQATDLISRILIGSDLSSAAHLFSHVQQLTGRFTSVHGFESYLDKPDAIDPTPPIKIKT